MVWFQLRSPEPRVDRFGKHLRICSLCFDRTRCRDDVLRSVATAAGSHQDQVWSTASARTASLQTPSAKLQLCLRASDS